MNDLLFDVPINPSPRLQWMERHGVRVVESPEESPHRRYKAVSTDPTCGTAYAATEEDAVRDFGHMNQIRLWNQEESRE